MLEGIDSRQRIEYSLKRDKDEPKTLFVIKPLTGIAMLNLADVYKDGQIKMRGSDIVELLDSSIDEIKNHPDVETCGKRKVIESLELQDLEELINKVTEVNNITDSDKKK